MVTTADPSLSRALLDHFARETGVTSDRPPRRYLWTDAFAVCGFLGHHRTTGDPVALETALALIDQVHRVLGRHRPDDPRSGWISGLDEEEGSLHPTAGGLRIGKPEPERGPDEPLDPRGEWDRDGQYFHYLTRWMHALRRAWRLTGEVRYHRWAVELARAAHRGFVVEGPGGGRAMAWKASIDLQRPLVPSMGQHDPLDGRVTFQTLRATAPPHVDGEALLERECDELDAVCRGRSWTTDDALGIGGLLVDCLRMRQVSGLDMPLAPSLEATARRDAAASLLAWIPARTTALPPHRRLAFRELGLAIGLEAARRLMDRGAGRPGGPGEDTWREAVTRALPEGAEIVGTWSRPGSRSTRTWTDHEDINAVMLAVALLPDGYLDL